MSVNEKEVCKHYQTGFCKYRQQCTKEHVKKICNHKYECKDITCKMRHPKICKIFELFGKCNNKVEELENEVKKLKLELRLISKKVK